MIIKIQDQEINTTVDNRIQKLDLIRDYPHMSIYLEDVDNWIKDDSLPFEKFIVLITQKVKLIKEDSFRSFFSFSTKKTIYINNIQFMRLSSHEQGLCCSSSNEFSYNLDYIYSFCGGLVFQRFTIYDDYNIKKLYFSLLIGSHILLSKQLGTPIFIFDKENYGYSDKILQRLDKMNDKKFNYQILTQYKNYNSGNMVKMIKLNLNEY